LAFAFDCRTPLSLRWTAAGMLQAEQQFRRIIGYRDLAKLVSAIERHGQPANIVAAREDAAEPATGDVDAPGACVGEATSAAAPVVPSSAKAAGSRRRLVRKARADGALPRDLPAAYPLRAGRVTTNATCRTAGDWTAASEPRAS
jgi:hypothetical protein